MQDGTYLKLAQDEFVPISPSKGYWVGTEEVTLSEIKPLELIGIWTAKTGKVYYDRTTLVPNLDEAIALAKKHNQLAIWDVVHSLEIAIEN